MERKKYSMAIIGAGPGGYVAAIRSAQLGRSVALIDNNQIGGTCLNVGCIPTKALLSNASIIHSIRRAKEFGITVNDFDVNYAVMKEQKDKIVTKIRTSLENLIRANKITIFRAHAQFESPTSLKLIGQDNLYIDADQIIIATGSKPLDIAAFPCDHHQICDSTSILEITTLPERLSIIGGGYIGCEFASLFADLGVKVTIIEAQPSLLSMQGPQIAKFLTQQFVSRGITIRTNVTVQKIEKDARHVHLHLSDQTHLDTDLCLVAVGRKIVSDNLNLQAAGLQTDAKGAILTNERMETAVRGIYAIGDVTGRLMLAHVASHQGIVAAMNAAGHDHCMNYQAIPSVVFTRPEIATVGISLDEALQNGYTPVVGTFPFTALGKAIASRETEGFAQIVSDRKTGQILGAQIVGAEASNLIAEIALAIENELTVDSILETIHAHPTRSECWHEAAALINGHPIHFPPRMGA